MAKKAKIVTLKQIELRRWCIDQAMRWPSYEERVGYPQVAGSVYQQLGGAVTRKDADVIGRAKIILAWVTGGN